MKHSSGQEGEFEGLEKVLLCCNIFNFSSFTIMVYLRHSA